MKIYRFFFISIWVLFLSSFISEQANSLDFISNSELSSSLNRNPLLKTITVTEEELKENLSKTLITHDAEAREVKIYSGGAVSIEIFKSGENLRFTGTIASAGKGFVLNVNELTVNGSIPSDEKSKEIFEFFIDTFSIGVPLEILEIKITGNTLKMVGRIKGVSIHSITTVPGVIVIKVGLF